MKSVKYFLSFIKVRTNVTKSEVPNKTMHKSVNSIFVCYCISVRSSYSVMQQDAALPYRALCKECFITDSIRKNRVVQHLFHDKPDKFSPTEFISSTYLLLENCYRLEHILDCR
jgi:hypothetical protein